jgi:hypothetical protein
MLKNIDKQIVTTFLILILVLLIPTFMSLYSRNRSIVIADGIVKNFIEKVKERSANSSCNDIGISSSYTGEKGQTIISNNGGVSNVLSKQNSDETGSSNVISSSSSGSGSGVVSGSNSSNPGEGGRVITSSGSSNIDTTHGDSSSQSIVSVLGGSDSLINNMICGGPGNNVLVGGGGKNNVIMAVLEAILLLQVRITMYS